MEHCERFLDLITQSLDGPLALEDRQALELHLEQCPECRLLSQQLLEIRSELHTWEDQEVPEGFTQGVMNRIRAEEQKPKIVPIWKHPQFKMFGSIAACAVICLGLWQAGTPQVMQDASLSTETAAPAAEMQTLCVTADATADEAAGAKLAQEPAAETAPPAAPSKPMQQADHSTAQFYDYSRSEAKQAEQDLIQLIQNTLGEPPGTLLVVDQILGVLDGTWHTTEDGRILLVLDTQPEDELWKTFVDTALLYAEFGDGPIVFVQTN